MPVQKLVLSLSSSALESYLKLDPYGAFNGQGSASDAANQNAGAFNGEWDAGTSNGLQNIGARAFVEKELDNEKLAFYILAVLNAEFNPIVYTMVA